ncbi:hypothetical protein ACFFLS_05565 [Flavobacterium procerum]|uniref:Uncharacterized protein n=1 Tax=Flavobacterium procerum TaxID=1455569 RepID=A0ABV6BNH3_9FLAO
MKNIILILIFLVFSSCEKKEKRDESSILKSKNINEIVAAVIAQDSLPVSKNNASSRMFCVDLTKINIYIPEKSDNPNLPPPPSFNGISINQLLKSKVKEEIFFSTADSAFLISQNKEQNEFQIEEEIIKKINSTTSKEEKIKQEKGEKYDFYKITIPVFSKDMTKAYVELNHFCGSLCGEGRVLFLSKINGKWIIVANYQKWIS